MGRRPGVKKREIPVDFKQKIDEISTLAKKRAVTFLDQCLCAHHLSAPDHQELIVTVSKALGISSSRAKQNGDDEDETTEEIPAMEVSSSSSSSSSGKQRSSSRVSSSSSSSSSSKDSKSKLAEEHNEVCEVCEKGGDLLCCDSCTLVFHVQCIRPKLSAVPKGRWSCAHCVADGMGPGDEIAARKAVVSMGRLSRGLESDDDEDESYLNVGKNAQRSGEVVVVRSGKRFIVRRTAHSQITELGRYDLLEEALCSIKSSLRSKVKGPTGGSANSGSSASSSGKNSKGDDNNTDNKKKDDDDGLWCTECMDDPAVVNCAFCGCRTCFGKHESEYLLLCDSCDQESHTFCLDPQLTEVPTDAWFCGYCVKVGNNVASMDEGGDEDDVGEGDDATDDAPVRFKGRPGRPRKTVAGPDGVIVGKKLKGRGRGRPPGTNNKLGIVSVTGNVGGGGSSGSLNELSVHAKRQSNASLLSDATTTGTSRNLTDSASASQSQQQTTTTGGDVAPAVVEVAGTGVKAVLAILEKANATRPFWPSERAIMTQMREWAPLEDLEVVHAALVAQKSVLLAKVLASDPNYVEPESASRLKRKHELLSMQGDVGGGDVDDVGDVDADGAMEEDDGEGEGGDDAMDVEEEGEEEVEEEEEVGDEEEEENEGGEEDEEEQGEEDEEEEGEGDVDEGEEDEEEEEEVDEEEEENDDDNEDEQDQ